MMNTKLSPVAVSANGVEVFLHPESHSHRPDLNKEAISKITIPENSTFFRETVDLGRIIGKDHLVPMNIYADTWFMWKRGNRTGESRMVLKEAEDTSFVTIILCVAHEEDETPAELVGKWILVTLFEGKQGEREPFDRAFLNGKNPEGKAKSEAFWKENGLVPTESEKEEIIDWAIKEEKKLSEEDYDEVYYTYNLVTSILDFYEIDY